jgi:hypothetical protein
MSFQLSSAQVETLLYELCVVLGFCLPLDEQTRLRESPPTDVDAFTDAVIRAEGLDPNVDIPLHMRRDIRSRVAEHFRRAEDEKLFAEWPDRLVGRVAQ